MTVAVAPALERLVAAPPARRRRIARALLASGVERAEWTRQLDEIHGVRPELEAPAVRALARECLANGDRDTAAWFRLLEGRAEHRAGSPHAAAETFEKAARELEAVGDRKRAAQARVMRVDALAVSGRVDEAIRLAHRLRPALRGDWAPIWRHVLAINEGNAWRLRGDLRRAIALYEAAARGLSKQRRQHTAAIARHNAGVALVEAGLSEDAVLRFDESERVFVAGGQHDMALETRYNRAWAFLRGERLGEAIAALGGLVKEHASRGIARRESLCRLDLADALLRARDRASAYREAKRAAKGLLGARANAEASEALLLAATAAPSAHAARRALRRARAAAISSGRPGVVLRCDLAGERARRTAGEACSESGLARLAARARALGHDEMAAEAGLVVADAKLECGDVRGALKHLGVAARAMEGRPWIRASVEAGRAACLARQGRRREAIEALRRVSGFLDAVRAGLPGSWLRTTFVLSRLDPYLGRIELLLERGDRDDRREAEALLDALASRRFLEQSRPPKLRGKVDALRRRLHSLYDRLGRGAGSSRGPDTVAYATAVREARDLERRVADAWRTTERSGRVAASVATARPRPAALRSSEAAFHLWRRGDRLAALLRRGPDVASVTDLGPIEEIDLAAARLRFHADRLRLLDAVDPAPFFAALRGLSDRLLAPVRAEEGLDSLRLVLDPDVPDLPWELLPIDGRPACAALRMLRVPCLRVRRASPASRGESTWVAAEDDRLPGIGDESTGMPAGSRLLRGPEATTSALADALARPGVVHVSGHGIAAFEAPPLGGVRVHGGWFTATDLPPKVRADLVVLGACRTGLDRGEGAHAWGALPTALLAAGARRVVWSDEDLDDMTAARFATRFHSALVPAELAGPPGAASEDVEVAFGTTVESLWTDPRAAAGLVPLRLSGVLP